MIHCKRGYNNFPNPCMHTPMTGNSVVLLKTAILTNSLPDLNWLGDLFTSKAAKITLFDFLSCGPSLISCNTQIVT